MLNFGRYREADEIIARIDAVTEADLRRLAEGILASKPTLAALGPVCKMPKYEVILERLQGKK